MITLASLVSCRSKEEVLSHAQAIDASAPLGLYNETRLSRYGIPGLLNIDFDPCYRSMSKNHKYFRLEVTVDLDIVQVLLLNLNMYPVFYLTLYNFPISATRNQANEERVLNALIDNKIIGAVYFSDVDAPFFAGKEVEPKDNITEFYSDVAKRFAEIDTGHYRGKYGLNQLKKNPNIVFRGLSHHPTEEDVANIEKLFQGFLNYSKAEGRSISYQESYRNMIKALRVPHSRVVSQLLYDRDILLAAKIFLPVYGMSKIVYNGYSTNIVHSDYLNKHDLPANTRTRLSNQMFYLSLEDCLKEGVEVVCSGKAGSSKKLYQYKLSENRQMIQYSVFRVANPMVNSTGRQLDDFFG